MKQESPNMIHKCMSTARETEQIVMMKVHTYATQVRTRLKEKRVQLKVVYLLALCSVIYRQTSLMPHLVKEWIPEELMHLDVEVPRPMGPANIFVPWNSSKHLLGVSFPYIYWINLNTSTDRRHIMRKKFEERNLSNVQRRMPAVTAEQMQQMLWKNDSSSSSTTTGTSRITFPGSTFHNNTRDLSRNLYALKEGACTTSHLQSIHQAYLDGHEVAIFTEDDSFLRDEFIVNWRRHISQAPADWQVLQLVSNNPNIVSQHRYLKDPWVTWLPDVWSTAAILMNRRGMEAILNKTLSSYDPHTKQREWKIAEPRMVVADELLYHLGKPTYTSTYPFSSLLGFNSTIQDSPRPTREEFFRLENLIPTKWHYTLETSIFVYTSIQITSIEQFHHEWNGIQRDFHALCTRIHTTSCHWAVHLSVAVGTATTTTTNGREKTSSLVLGIQDSIEFINGGENRPPNLEVFVEKDSEKTDSYNKLQGLATHHMSKLKQYDYVLLKDSERRITGFPWLTFMEQKGQALVSGPLQENLESSYIRGGTNRLISSWYKYLHGFAFRTGTEQTKKLFLDVTPLEVPIVEYGFTLLNGSFADWFFSRVLLQTSSFLQYQHDWEVELMWCEAARDFRPSSGNTSSCVLVPLVSIQDFYLPAQHGSMVIEAPKKQLDRRRKGSLAYMYETIVSLSWQWEMWWTNTTKASRRMTATVMYSWMEASREWKRLTEQKDVTQVIKKCCQFQHCANEELCQLWR